MKFAVDEKLFENCIASLKQLIQIPSVKSAPTAQAPFGKPISQALELILQLAVDLGFKTRNLDGYVGIVEMGAGKEELGVLVHIDVVPPGDISKWQFPPFSGEIANDAIWGRGTLDDKGPAVAVLYAMKLLNDLGLDWKRRVRLIIGTDEESSWQDIDYYKQYEKPPTIAFTPDGCFPVTNSEKGILTIRYKKQFDAATSIIASVQAGEKYNMTPGVATAIINLNYEAFSRYYPQTNDSISIEPTADGFCLMTARGRDGRTSAPIMENNAIHILLSELKKVLPANDSFHEVLSFYELYLQNNDGSGHNCRLTDKVSGDLTLATCILAWDGKTAIYVANIRYPSTYKRENIISLCSKKLFTANFAWEVIEHKEGIYLPPDSPFIKTLLTIYNDHFSTNAKPESIAGGTYARAFPNTVAFGALIPGKPLNAHEVNEHVELEVIHHWLEIYAKAIYHLAAK